MTNDTYFIMDFFLGNACLFLLFSFLFKYEFVLGQDRIIGGDKTGIAKFPYMLYLTIGKKDNAKSVCGAAIISNEWAVTAAHCFDGQNVDYNKINVISGSANIKKLEKTASKHKVITVVKHEFYKHFKNFKSKDAVRADIAVFKVSPPFTFNQVTQPIKLPEQGQSLKISSVTVSGWGSTSLIGTTSTELRYVTIPYVDPKICKKKYGRTRVPLKEGEICYGASNPKVLDKCNGDSGSPLVNTDKILVGIVSWGASCGKLGLPGVYADAVYFRDWIKTKTGI